MGEALEVDYEALEALATRLDRIRKTLEETRADSIGDEGVFGDEALASEVRRFVDNWSQGRGRIIDDIGRLVEVVRAAAKAYRETERALKEGMTATTDGGAQPAPAAP
jgi:uncharacterized protein YukE